MPTINGAADSAFDMLRPKTGLPSDRKATKAKSTTTTPMMVSVAPKKRRKLVLLLSMRLN